MQSKKEHQSEEFWPSVLVRRFASDLIESAAGKPILDVACGAGRNAIFLASLGCRVICMDLDVRPLMEVRRRSKSRTAQKCFDFIETIEIDLIREPWPIPENSTGGIVNVHFTQPSVFPCFASSMISGGNLILETVPAHGGNYLQLPAAGSLKRGLELNFDFQHYEERKVGPPSADAVTVQLVGTRKHKL